MNNMEGNFKFDPNKAFNPDSHIGEYEKDGKERLYYGHDYKYFENRLKELGYVILRETPTDPDKHLDFVRLTLYNVGNSTEPLMRVELPEGGDGTISLKEANEMFFKKLVEDKEKFKRGLEQGHGVKEHFFYMDEQNELQLGTKEEKKG